MTPQEKVRHKRINGLIGVGFVAALLVLLGMTALGALLDDGTATPEEAATATTTIATTSSTTTTATPPATNALDITGLSPETVSFLGCTDVTTDGAWTKCTSDGVPVLLTTDSPTVAVAEAKKRPDYNEFGSVFYETDRGAVVYLPTIPTRLLSHVGPVPGMTVIDTDAQ